MATEGLQSLSSRDIIGRYFKRLEQAEGTSWINSISNLFQSDKDSEEYRWVGQVPQMREWIGGRQPQGLKTEGVIIKNADYESTLEFNLKELRQDKTGQIDIRISEQVQRAMAHWASLLSTLVIGGEAGVCYDGQFFFDTDHSEGDSGTQSNDLSIDISTLPAEVHGSTTIPSVEEMQQVILQAVQSMLGFKDDQGEPMNENASSFAIMVPISLWNVARAAVFNPVITSGQNNVLETSNMVMQVVPNARLTWTDKIAVFRTDGSVKPLIRQEELGIQVAAIAEGSELEFNERLHRYGLHSSRGVGYGMWQGAVLATMV